MQRTHTQQSIRFIVAAALAVAFARLAVPAPVLAQVEDRERGVYLGLTFMGSSLHVDDNGTGDFRVKDDGGGLMVRIGYSFNRVFSMEFSFGGAVHETSVQAIDANFGLAQLLFHYRFQPGKAFRPYIKGGFGGYGLEITDGRASARIEGGGLPIGGGFDYFFSRHFSLGVDLTHNIINYDKVDFRLGEATAGFDIDEEGAMTSLGLALHYYF